TPLEEARARLLPRLVGPSLLDGLGARAEAIHTRPLGHGAFVALVLAYEGRSRFVRRAELASWGLRGAEAEALAIERLAARSVAARMACLDTEAGPVVLARTRDGHDAARLLLPGLGAVLAQSL